jgi:Fic family protein
MTRCSLSINFDARKADAAYKPFPSFGEWADVYVDEVRWNRYTAQLEELRSATPDLMSRSLEIVKRAAALDTGAIEGLYETDRGFTFTVATQAAMWEDALGQRGPNVRSLFESQLRAYDFVLDLATHAVPIAEAWIRQLHSVICSSQDTYHAWTELGWQDLLLPKGEYKHLPNHVVKADGAIHSYAPVDMTPTEMYRLIEELRSEAFQSAHPAAQASYAHYALAAIHPFADGNGRSARALASVFSYRCCSVPVLILSENRSEYLAALSAADAGLYSEFVQFIGDRILDAIQTVRDGFLAAGLPSTHESIAAIEHLYRTKGGYTQDEVDAAGAKLMELVHQGFSRDLAEAGRRGIGVHVDWHLSTEPVLRPTSRSPLNVSRRGLYFSLATKPPARASVSRHVALEVPKDCGKDDDIIVQEVGGERHLQVKITDLLPSPSAQLQIRVALWSEAIARSALEELATLARKSLNST